MTKYWSSLAFLLATSSATMPDTFDCEWRKLAVSFAEKKIPGSEAKVFDALELGVKCNEQRPTSNLHGSVAEINARDLDLNEEDAIFVDVKGDDLAKGTINAPLASLQAAVDLSRSSGAKTILLNSGIHYTDTILLDSRDSGTTFSAADGESPVISAGKPLTNLKWTEHDTSNGKNIWVTDVDVDGLVTVPGLHYDEGRGRATKARFPNSDPWIMNEE